MVKKNNGIQKLINKFIATLQTQIRLKKVYLFGSFANGNEKEFSDIDLAVISPDFENMEPFERLVFLGNIAWKAGTPRIEAVGYTPREFASTSQLDFPFEIKQKGIALKIRYAA